ncbi:MAG: (d)CMP kinase [Flavobacteriaceae bacterium]|nr:(d)CMP kinase [Flavobacteriaceae bacterium]|tara:strand:+ start:261 stop:953 length:693 start_codon:yes stop_codon:yes gene_type:complete
MKKNIIIAIDGFASTGKSTLAKHLANYLNYIYVDSGSMYRAITYYALKNNYLPFNEENLKEFSKILLDVKLSFVFNKKLGYSEIFLNNNNIEKEIRSILVSNHVSSVATVSFIRKHMVNLQKKLSLDKGVVMDGRDIGTVVFPNAELKLFLTASAEVRAKRRYSEYVNENVEVEYDEVLNNLKSRDLDDSKRKDSPLIVADDALEIDNSFMSMEDQLIFVKSILKDKFNL